ncbi:DUF1800 domain-containing protein [Massilia sp. W12]|uniref:DUF1800 domain-containing protein n=1 Tax=Massilia sp. W12 TaxID=3126507 RepID=UPI0030CDA632
MTNGITPRIAPVRLATPANDAEAARFLAQAAFGGDAKSIANLKAKGYDAWLNEQFAMSTDIGYWDWMLSKGYAATSSNPSVHNGAEAVLWRKLMRSPDVLRQRVALALSEIFVVSMVSVTSLWSGYGAAGYMDMLAAHAFGNFRALLEAVTLSPVMGVYLGTRGNQKGNPATGRQPDENFAREIMQLFSIGLYKLNPDGSVKTDASGKALESYGLRDVSELAKVFTGWGFDGQSPTSPEYWRRPMVVRDASHATEAKSFLGVTIAADSGAGAGVRDLKIALDTLFNHPNVGPFIGRQLIQRLVSSNPSAAYVQRVAQAFANNGSGVRGDMKAVLRAILTDVEARSLPQNNYSGKLREPMLRLLQWARTFNAVSASGNWNLRNTSDPDSGLAQSPLRSPTVFNFFRPGYVPPSGVMTDPSLVAPELQITTESTIIGYANFMQRAINGGYGDLTPDYTPWLPLAADVVALTTQLNTVLAAGQISASNLATIQNGISDIVIRTDADRLNRIKAAIMLVMCAPEYLVQK